VQLRKRTRALQDVARGGISLPALVAAGERGGFGGGLDCGALRAPSTNMIYCRLSAVSACCYVVPRIACAAGSQVSLCGLFCASRGLYTVLHALRTLRTTVHRARRQNLYVCDGCGAYRRTLLLLCFASVRARGGTDGVGMAVAGVTATHAGETGLLYALSTFFRAPPYDAFAAALQRCGWPAHIALLLAAVRRMFARNALSYLAFRCLVR